MKSRYITTIIYLIYSCFHSFQLINYNKQLDGLNAFEVMINDEGASGKYLVMTMLLIFVGFYLIYLFWKNRFDLYDDKDIIVSIFLVVMILASFILMIVAISNPILQSALTVIVIVGIGGVALNS